MNESVHNPVLVADVGGTNLNLALVAREGSGYRLLRKARYRTQDEASMVGPILRFLAAEPSLPPRSACLAGAGPVVDHRIHLTNAPWDIDGPALERELKVPVRLLNDFTALSCGVLLLDPADGSQVTALPHGTGHVPTPDPDGLILVVGAGTGLGVGFAIRTPRGPRVFPSEGGHIGLPIFDETSLALWQHLAVGCSGPPGAELVVSGQGLPLLLRFLLETGRVERTPQAAAILELPAALQPAAVSGAAEGDPACARAMALFVAFYARFCAELCTVFLPSGGLFLAGGIAGKNARQFTEGGRFMATFERNYRPHLDHLTRTTPVYLVHDYDVSLLGAAHAPFCQD